VGFEFGKIPFGEKILCPSLEDNYVVRMRYRLSGIHEHIIRPLLENHEPNTSDEEVDILAERLRLAL